MLYSPPVGTLGVDTSGSVNEAQAQALKARGFRFVVRSLTVPDGSIHPKAVTAAEVTLIHAAGLALGFYQMFQTVTLTPAQGTKDGQSAAMQARALGAPSGMTIYGDSEGQVHESAANEVAYWNAWAAAIKAGGYVAGMYVGPGPRMTGPQIGALPDVHSYWMAGSIVPTPTPRGFAMFQLNPPNQVIAGQAFDIDCTQVDFSGGAPAFWR